jgi:hypothetical protein
LNSWRKASNLRCWAGRLPGLLRAEHYFVIEHIGPARVRFRHGEIFSGLLVPIVWPILRRSGREVYEAMNAALKRRVERRTAATIDSARNAF